MTKHQMKGWCIAVILSSLHPIVEGEFPMDVNVRF